MTDNSKSNEKKDENKVALFEKNKIIVRKEELDYELYYKWLHDEYTKQVSHIVDMKKTDYNKGMLKRLSRLSTTRYINLFDTSNNTIVVFKLHSLNINKETNYSTLFCMDIKNVGEFKHSIPLNTVFGDLIFRFCSTAPSLISCDGEYHNRFVLFQNVIQLQTDRAEMWNDLDEYINYIKKLRSWVLHANYYYSDIKSNEKKEYTHLEQVIKMESIPIKLFIIMWFNTIYNEYYQISETHMNTTFKEIIFSEWKEDKAYFTNFIAKHGIANVELFRIESANMIYKTIDLKQYRAIPYGYKMIPLNIKEVQDPMRLHYKPWREFYISNKCNDFIINKIAPGFSIICDWFYIRNTKKGLYDNKSQFERLKNSEIAKEIVRTLNEAQRSTYFASSNLGSKNKTSENIREWISIKFKKLNEKIKDAIDFSIEDIIMSDITLTFSSEYVGRTYLDSIHMIEKNKTYSEKLGNPLNINGYDFFCKYIFEICYNLLAINSRLHVIHGDFHLNNATIGFLYLSEEPENRILYELESGDKFLFNNNGYFSCIIDFSRAILDPEHYDILTDMSMPPSFKLIKDYDKFVVKERSALLNLYISLFPNKAQNKEELIVIFKKYYDAIFRLMTCVDLYMFSMRLSRLLSSNLKINIKCVKLLETIIKESEFYITSEINKLISDPEKYSKIIMARNFPIHDIIIKCFPMYMYKNQSGVITDCFSLKNKFEHSICKYELFPDALKYGKYYKDGALVDFTRMNDFRRVTREDYEKRKLRNLEYIKYLSTKYNIMDYI
jgi:hypothetical protein